jgi:hypothetical protein
MFFSALPPNTMTIDPATPNFDPAVRRYVYDLALQTGRPPTAAETAAALSTTPAEVQASFRRLADAHIVVLQRDTGELLMANPFAAVPTPFLAQVDGRTYYANCVWDVMGIPAMLRRDAVIQTSCGDCGTAVTLRIVNGSLEPAVGIVHFAVPAAQWWADIVFT